MLLLKLFNQSLVLNYSFEGVDLTCDATQDEDASLYVFISSEMEQDLMGLKYFDSPLKQKNNVDFAPSSFDIPSFSTHVMYNLRAPTFHYLSELL